MKPSSDTKIRFQGNFKEKRRANPRRVVGFLAGVASFAGFIYLFFFSPVFAIQSVGVSGFGNNQEEAGIAAVMDIVNIRTWNMPLSRSIIYFDTDNAQRGLAKRYPALKDITITKDYRHTLVVTGVERTAAGVWCMKSDCTYFDDDGVSWGHALPSSGALLTVIESQQEDYSLNQEFIHTAKLLSEQLPNMGVIMKKIIIPQNTPAEFHVQTIHPYIIKFATDQDIAHQLQTLQIFLQDKKKDPNFNPVEYIDVRIEDRVYFK